MKKIFLILITLVPFLGKAQVTLIPDQNFEYVLVNLGIDSDGLVNGQMLTNDALSIVDLRLGFNNIYDLTGLEAFVNLEKLTTYENPLGGSSFTMTGVVDVSMMPNLKELDVRSCNIGEIDLSKNPLLEIVRIGSEFDEGIFILNDIKKLDLSNNPNVRFVEATRLYSFNFLNMRNNIANVVVIKLGGAENNNSFYDACIEVDDHIAATYNAAPYDTWTVVSEKKNYFFSDDCKKALSNELFIQNNFKVYPNPAVDYVTIEYDENAGVQLRGVQILDSSGKWVRSVNENFHQINVSSLSEGVYLFVIQTDKGNKTEKVVVK